MSYLVHLQQFEGPLGLLLYLIRKEEMDVMNINVNEITRQYLDYIRMMKELDLEMAGEFVAMAATLIHIKSRMLLPQYDEQGEVLETEDPRKELVQKLLDYQKFQEAAKTLYSRPLLGRDVFVRGIREDLRDEEELGAVIVEDDGLFSLIAAYRRAVRKAQRAVHKVRPKVQSIASRIMELSSRLTVGARVILRDLMTAETPQAYRAQLLITFLSMLELGRMGLVSVFQSETYGDIHIEARKTIERNALVRVQEFDSRDTDEVAKAIIDNAIEEKIDMAEAMEAHDGQSPQLGLVPTADIVIEQIAVDNEYADTHQVATDADILEAEAELEHETGIPIPEIEEIAEEQVAMIEAGEATMEEAVAALELAPTREEIAALTDLSDLVDRPGEGEADPQAVEQTLALDAAATSAESAGEIFTNETLADDGNDDVPFGI
ncbi:MAG: segregation/condensation protein A [Bdellovibrionota bacterium]